MNVKWYASDTHCPGHIRGEVLAREINRERNDCRIDWKVSIPISDFYGTDIMVFQRQVHPLSYTKMRAAQNQGIKCIYELDDDILHTPPDFPEPYNFYNKPEVQKQVKAYMTDCDAVIVSTHTLALSVKEITGGKKPIFVIPNYLDTFLDNWDTAYAVKQTETKDQLTIGWMASKSHKMDAELVGPALNEIMQEYDNVDISLIGWIDKKDFPWADKYNGRVKMQQWVDISMLPYAMKDFDIGLAPLVDNAFNRAKSNIKWLQYGALGVPCVMSDAPPYEEVKDGVDGVLVKNGEWKEAICGLLDDKVRRMKMGAECRRTVLAEWDMRKKSGAWVSVFKKIRQGV
jgi:glycosyltransferase involved in cell wall biosynthesis